MVAPTPPSSPLERSTRQGTNVLSVLLYLLAGLLAVAMTLVWTIDEASNAYARGWMFCGLSLTMAALGYGLQWAMSRPPPASGPTPAEVASTTRFRRLRLGPAWTDWLVPLLPLLLALPIFVLGLDKRPALEALGGALFVLVVLELVVLPALVVARREWVELELHPQGLLLTMRSGRWRLLAFGELRGVRLTVGQTRNFQFGSLELHVGEPSPLAFREPMSGPLPEIAAKIAWHMRAPLEDLWSQRGGRGP